MTKREILGQIEQSHMELHNGTLDLDDFFERMCDLNEEWDKCCDEEDDDPPQAASLFRSAMHGLKE